MTDTKQKLIDIPVNCGSHDFDGMNLSYLDSGGEKPVRSLVSVIPSFYVRQLL